MLDFTTKNFSKFHDGNFWAIEQDKKWCSFSKSEDDGSINPDRFILGGIVSNFSIAGNFQITTHFSLNHFPFPPEELMLNEAVLGLVAHDNDLFYLLRFHLGSRDLVEVFASPGVVLGEKETSINSGIYKISRINNVVTGYIKTQYADNFAPVASVSNFDKPVKIKLFAAQGRNSGIRSKTAINIRFDNLIIDAEDSAIIFDEH